jgi:hypothetical protein
MKSISYLGNGNLLPYYGGVTVDWFDPGSGHRPRHLVNFFRLDTVNDSAEGGVEYIGTGNNIYDKSQ